MTDVDRIADSYVEEWAALDPLGSTYAGIAGHDGEMTNFTPEGYAARAELDRRTLAELAALSPADEAQRVSIEAMQERLGLALEMYDAGAVTSEVSVIADALHGVREVFDLMATDSEEAVRNIAQRLQAVPKALKQIQGTLLEAASHGHVSSRRQMLEVAKQCDVWVDEAQDDFWPAFARRAVADANVPGALQAEVELAARAAREATAEHAEFLRSQLAPLGRESDAAGREHYKLASRYFLGAAVDLDETYAWGFEELARIEADMRAVANQIVPGGSVRDAITALNEDPARRIAGKEAFRDWMQGVADEAIRNLHGTHFDIPEQVRHIECCIAPTSDGAVYYTGPSEDFSRPGRMWWAVPGGNDSFATWQEVTTVYHEGVPGHHLQVAQTQVRSDQLNRWRRLLAWCSGHGEGWALYAERLMDELGYLDDPGAKLGMLDSQAFRAARVIIDIGMHLEMPIPNNQLGDVDGRTAFHVGERFTPELGWEFLRAHSSSTDEVLRFELNRYLGWPGQAPSYKVGERIWLQARADAKARKGAGFDLKAFHRAALDLGSLGLDPLRQALSRI